MQRIYLSLILLAGLWCTHRVHAQAPWADTLNALQDGRLPEMFRLTRNPASLWQSERPDYTRVAGNWKHTDGDLRRPMMAAASDNFGVAAAGYAKVRNWIYQGRVEYSRQLDEDIAWSGVYDPYGGNPFLWTDSSRGDWERDHLKVSAVVNTPPLGRHWRAGLHISYHVGSGARKSDPKPFYRYRHLSLMPGITRKAGKHATIGAYGKAAFLQEDNELGFYNTSTGNILLYKLRGYGTYTRAPFVSAERQRRGTLYEAGAHYSYEKGRFLSVFNLYANTSSETVLEGVIRRQAYGYYNANSFGGAAAFFMNGMNKGSFASISFDAVLGDAEDVAYNARTAYSTRYRVEAKAGYWRGGLQWELRPFLYYDEYADVATATNFNVTSAGGLLVLNWRKQLTRKASLQLKPAAGYRYVLQDNLQQGASNIIIRELILPDYRYFSTSRMLASIGCGYFLNTGYAVVHGIEANVGTERASQPDNKTISLKYSIVF